ncbi:hypothetical protein [Flavilitoribacter nigricans]|uniref:DoxX family protein n=1 Tax=Flavilitoribacter nigricans (strain ATCC 23147 / DSM 23189 / NBRC 102662 / NCIMB 1420 / SS-2) TaxID=1122177 RepID=A0A2D0N6Z6_FLAN2|nr:hypothetical protein [Flavilitoribacter nigricans]PHN04291.1 hypothetical protein CRP01_22270 [Flavilitoribacter nigricans DSM 23189 = NBRC 102662]
MEKTENLEPAPDAPWSWMKKFSFRFVGVYLLLYIFPFPVAYLPFTSFFTTAYSRLWEKIIDWVGLHIFDLVSISHGMTGSGDRTHNYVELFTKLVLALLIGAIWTAVDRRSTHYRKHYHWLTVWVRYYLGALIIGYGFAKVFKTQFPFPGLARLVENYGDSSPMGLAWNFMGYSKMFNLFTGLGEVIGGFLLFFRRTTTIGAFVLISVISTIVMMNFAYDIPVKLFSTHLLLMALFLLTPDIRRLYRFFISNEPVAPADLSSPITDKKWNTVRIVLKALFISYAVLSQLYSGLQREKQWGDHKVKPPLYGIYEVETFIRNGDTIPPLLTEDRRWRRFIVPRYEGIGQVQYMDDQLTTYKFEADSTLQTATLRATESSPGGNIVLEHPDSNLLQLRGVFQADTLEVHLRKKDLNDFLLVNRGFHWINEVPYNR